ncbi:ejaculatory bulb-specific protein 3-like, partial [Acyrthosiphon pisum]|uniref:Uncharacterized protein n=1 Tax=Acyrthosiphon pisum TaxID=7029 RepID=A0A8R2NNY9_ACYPI
ICVLIASSVCFTLAQEKYSTKYENFDVDKVLNNDSLLTSYINCLLDEENFSEEDQALKILYVENERSTSTDTIGAYLKYTISLHNYDYIISCLIKFTGVIPDALKTDCSKCTDVQVSKLLKIMKFLMKNRSADFDRLTTNYDPSGEYKKKL